MGKEEETAEIQTNFPTLLWLFVCIVSYDKNFCALLLMLIWNYHIFIVFNLTCHRDMALPYVPKGTKKIWVIKDIAS